MEMQGQDGLVCCPTKGTLGYDQGHVDLSLRAGKGQVRAISAVYGRFDPATTKAALEACSQCLPHTIEEMAHWQGGFPAEVFIWGEELESDMARANRAPVFDRLEYGRRLMVTKDLVLEAATDMDMRQALDTLQGKESLASSLCCLLYRDTTEAMASLGAFYFALTTETKSYLALRKEAMESRNSGEALERLSRLMEGPLLRPFTAAAVGLGVDVQGKFVGIALRHEGTDLAEENGRLLPLRLALASAPSEGIGRWPLGSSGWS